MSIIATITKNPIHIDSDNFFYSNNEKILFNKATEEEKKKFILDRLDRLDLMGMDYEITYINE